MVLAAFAASSCAEKELQEEFVVSPAEFGLTIKGTRYDRFAEETCQYGYMESNHEFRVSNDNMSDYYVLRLDRIPGVGEETSGELVYTTEDNIVSKPGLKFKLLKVEKDYYWFWNKRNSIGTVVRKL